MSQFFVIFDRGGILYFEHAFSEETHAGLINEFIRSIVLDSGKRHEKRWVLGSWELQWLIDKVDAVVNDHSELIYLLAFPFKFPVSYGQELLEDCRLLFPKFHETGKEAFFSSKFSLLLQKYESMQVSRSKTGRIEDPVLQMPSSSISFAASPAGSSSSINNFADDERLPPGNAFSDISAAASPVNSLSATFSTTDAKLPSHFPAAAAASSHLKASS